jgi:DNA-binding response OmpR family regulator
MAATRTQGQKVFQPSTKPVAEFVDNDLLSRIPTDDLKEIRRLSSFFPVIVLIPRPRAESQVASRNISLARSSTESSRTPKLRGIFRQGMEGFKNTSEESMFAFGDVTISFSAMEALRNDKAVVLTTMEFKTLKYLIQNAGRVISRDELLNKVWGYENYPCTRTVDNRILMLRQKLERDPSRPVHFRTIRGAGYKFLP